MISKRLYGKPRLLNTLFVVLLAGLSVDGIPSNAYAAKSQKPNILWIYIEDMSPLLSCYGDPLIQTPNFDRLAKNGVLFEKCFAPTPVCSPCRSAIITGVMSTTFGTHNHRTLRKADVRLPSYAKTLPELFRQAGYYTFNCGKTDYNFNDDSEAMYDQQCSNRIKLPGNKIKNQQWKGYPDDRPFFGQHQREGGKLKFYYRRLYNMGDWKSRPTKMPLQTGATTLPACYPKDPILVANWTEHYDCISVQDWDVGMILENLKQTDKLENTIIFTFSDHGMYLPRHKQFCYDGGLHVPLIISYFGNNPSIKKVIPAGKRRKDLVSLLDISATSLALAGLAVPDWYESRDVFAPDFRRDYIVATRDRCDFTIDRIRAVRTHNMKYIKNFMTDRPYMQPNYRDGRDYMDCLRKMYSKGKLSAQQAWFWADERPAEELYDLSKDPGELNNLAANPEYQDRLKEMRRTLDHWIKETGDKGQIPEDERQLLAVLKLCQKMKWQAVNPEYEPVRKKYADQLTKPQAK